MAEKREIIDLLDKAIIRSFKELESENRGQKNFALKAIKKRAAQLSRSFEDTIKARIYNGATK
jgi:hypothetical protein